MQKKKYQFDRTKLQFVEVTKSLKFKIKRAVIYISIIILTAFLVHFTADKTGLNLLPDTLQEEKKELLTKYDSLNLILNRFESKLTDLQTRDDNIYRCICQMEPLPASIREAGLGGTRRYPMLEGYNHSDLMIKTTELLDNIELRLSIQLNSFTELLQAAKERKTLFANKPAIQPISLHDKHWISSDFGVRTDPISKEPTAHYGIDIAARKGTCVYATGGGIIQSAKFSDSGYGKEIVIDHGFGFSSRYAHLNQILVYEGQKISRGKLIGTLGNSGKSTGPHLHYEVRFHSKPLNPMLFYSDDLTPEEYDKITISSESIDN